MLKIFHARSISIVLELRSPCWLRAYPEMSIEKPRFSADIETQQDNSLPTNMLRRSRDRDLIKVAKYVLTHSADISIETAYALLSAAKKRRKK
jgi:hypothetical protein